MKYISHIRLVNFKKFQLLELELNKGRNVFIGDNESGKSTILQALDLVISGSRHKVEGNGLFNLFNKKIINQFLASKKKYDDLPKLIIELFLKDSEESELELELEGQTNSLGKLSQGIRLICEPNDEFSSAINEILQLSTNNFPYEFYSIIFETFGGKPYSSYRKYLRSVLIDSSQISNEQATRDYIKTLYESRLKPVESNNLENLYRESKEKFGVSNFSDLNQDLQKNIAFALKTSSKSNLIMDLGITKDGIDIDQHGKGLQCFVKTRFALKNAGEDLEVILLEEPENHLSHSNMKRLIKMIQSNSSKQVFIATHSSMVSSGLDLRQCFFVHPKDQKPITLRSISKETAEFFVKAPHNGLLEFILSSKVILVEGDSEFMLMEQFMKSTSPSKEDARIHIISVGGTSFKRYLEIAKLLPIKTAVIRDNDGNYKENCINNYKGYREEQIEIFSDTRDAMSTFEKVLFSENEEICNSLFKSARRTLSVEKYMLANKTESAFKLLSEKGNELKAPGYIQKAIEWIRK